MSDALESLVPLKLVPTDATILHAKAMEVEIFDENLHQRVKQMVDFIYKELEGNAAGLAAPQVGIPLNIVIINAAMYAVQEEFIACINPEIRTIGTQIKLGLEGCFSIPGKVGIVPRFAEIEGTYRTTDGKTVSFHHDDKKQYSTEKGPRDKQGARVFQHEVDHLFGKLYTGVEGTILFDNRKDAEAALKEIETVLFDDINAAKLALQKIKDKKDKIAPHIPKPS